MEIARKKKENARHTIYSEQRHAINLISVMVIVAAKVRKKKMINLFEKEEKQAKKVK